MPSSPPPSRPGRPPARRSGLGLPAALRGDRRERERVEQARLGLRADEVLPEADRCPACAEARRDSGDPTFLCREHLAHFKAPKAVEFVTELPKTATGKVQKFALRAQARAGQSQQT